MSEISDNKTNDGNIDGYVSPNARNTNVPLLGHMVTYRFREPERGAASASYRAMVEKAKELGLDSSHVPAPRFGRNAFKTARQSFKTSPSWQTVTMDSGVNWDNMRCRARYECHRMISEYVIQRIRTGHVDGVEHTETTPLYRVKYTAGSGDVNARAYHIAYVKSVWDGEESLSEAEKAILLPDEEGEVRDGTQYIELEAYDGLDIDDMAYYSMAFNLIQERYRQVSDQVDVRLFRSTVRNLLMKEFNAIPMTAIRGAVIVPDTRTEDEKTGEDGERTAPAYLDQLEAINELMRWYGDEASDIAVVSLPDEEVPGVEPEATEEDVYNNDESLADQIQALHRAKCQMTIMCYINDVAQMETLQEEMTIDVHRQMEDYFKKCDRALKYLDADDAKAIDKAVESLRKARTDVDKTLDFYCGSNWIEGVNLKPEVVKPRQMGLRTRLGSLGISNSKSAQLRELLNFDEADKATEEE
jgi:hypothetical protein